MYRHCEHLYSLNQSETIIVTLPFLVNSLKSVRHDLTAAKVLKKICVWNMLGWSFPNLVLIDYWSDWQGQRAKSLQERCQIKRIEKKKDTVDVPNYASWKLRTYFTRETIWNYFTNEMDSNKLLSSTHIHVNSQSTAL